MMINTPAFWNCVEVTGNCWNWTGKANYKGYGYFSISGRRYQVHRWSYEHFVGPIPAGLTIDHLCRNRICVRPEHLEPVTNRENILRGASPTAENARKAACLRGHPLGAPRLLKGHPAPVRRCRTCVNDTARRTGRGRCSVCPYRIDLRIDGTLQRHTLFSGHEPADRPCEGSWKLPREESLA